MPSNLVDTSRALFTDDFLAKYSVDLGEKKENVEKAINSILPSILIGIYEKAQFDKSASHILPFAEQSYKAKYENNLYAYMGLDGIGLLNDGKALLINLFGKSNVESLTSIIANFSGINSASSGFLLGICTPLILSVLYQRLESDKVDAAQTYSYLIDQKSNFSIAIPDGLYVGSLFSADSFEDEQWLGKKIVRANLRKILLFIFFLIAALASWIIFKNRGKREQTEFSNATEVIPVNDEGIFEIEIGKIDSISGDIIYQQGETVAIELPRYAGIILVGKRSTEDKLVEFLNDSTKSVDNTTENWICLSAILFKKGTSTLTESSLSQLKNLVSISKAFPNLRFEIAAYTDSTSDAAGNLSFSQKKADAVFIMLKKMGIKANSISSVNGFGQKNPVADNSTKNGRAQNRRVSIRVVSK